MTSSGATRSLQSLLRLWLKFSDANRFDDATWKPGGVQEQKLLQIVRRNQATVYGGEKRFDRIRSVKDFQARVPINDYDTLSPYIERSLSGEGNVLTADEPVMFARTSNTTGSAKFIPVPPSYLEEYSHGVHIHTYRMFTDYRDILEGTVLVPAYSDATGHSESGVPYGAISGYLARKQPRSIRRFYSLPHEIAKIGRPDTKLYVTLLYALASDVRLIAVPTPASLILMADKMREHAGDLIEDIRRGSISPTFAEGAPPGMAAGLHADARRADVLQGIVSSTGRLLPAEAWPNLRLLSCWKGANMSLYLRRLPDYYGDCPVRDLGYMASEGRGATPLVNSGCGGVLNISSHFFEFVPEGDYGRPDAEFLTCDQLESDHEYFVYFTTSAGLYRYDIKDVVRVVDFYRNTPVIQFVRKGQGITSLTGEKLTESQVTDALLEVVDRHAFDVNHLTACAEWSEPPRYALYAELGDSMTRERRELFLREFDRALRTRNLLYHAYQEQKLLGPPVLKPVASGTYEELRRARVAQGAAEAQVKIPQLSTDMSFGDRLEVLEEIELTS